MDGLRGSFTWKYEGMFCKSGLKIGMLLGEGFKWKQESYGVRKSGIIPGEGFTDM